MKLFFRKMIKLTIFAVTLTAVNSFTAFADDADFMNSDQILGDVNAPIEIIEYASTSCGACKVFEKEIFPKLKKKYIDTGKVKFIYRSYMLNIYDVAPTVMTRCVGSKKFYPFLSLIYKKSQFWLDQAGFEKMAAAEGKALTNNLFQKYSMQRVSKLARMVGVSKKKIEACASNPKVQKYILKTQQEGIKKYNLKGTPSIIVNGRYIEGFQFEDIEKAIKSEM